MQDLPALLQQLKDIHEPPSVSWWPLAPGWWGLLAFILVFGLLFILWRRKRKPNYVKQAQSELKKIQNRYQAQRDVAATIAEINALLKRVCIVRYGVTNVASLHGEAWLRFLDEKAFSNLFTQPKGLAFGTALYGKTEQLDIDYIFHASDNWLTRAQ